jgi:hypothetical protein
MRRGRHLYVKKQRGRVLGIVGAVLAVGAAGVGIYAAARLAPSFFGLERSPEPTTPPVASDEPECPTGQAAGEAPLGAVAWVSAGQLLLLDLDSCEERILVPADALPPVRFSHDGRWVAFGAGRVVPATGGEVQDPLGTVDGWQWSPAEDLLAGVTAHGGVILGGPDAARTELLSDGSGVERLAFSPDGRRLAVDADGDRVRVVDVADGGTTTVYQVPPGIEAPPSVAGWSPDGGWVLFWSRFPDRAGVPLNAAPIEGGTWTNVFDPVLPYRDLLTSCGKHLVVSGGATEVPHQGNQLLLTRAPEWRFENLSEDFSRSWILPSCSPDGRWIAATATPNLLELPPGAGVRSLWILSTDGKQRARLASTEDRAFELPRWSADGRFILVVRRGIQPDSPGVLLLLSVDPAAGTMQKVAGPLARLGPSPGEQGHTDWSELTDWYRPE